MSVPSEYTKSIKFEADDIKIPVEILVMHDKKNLNKSNFEMEVIEAAKESIKNIPILGYIRKIDGSDSKDFAGHEIELSIKDGELKFTYLERPIGVIPETNSYEYVEVNGKNYVKVIGYIWREYLNDGYEILQDNPNKSVSMEITVDDYAINKDGVFDIKAYRYLGVTVLGDSVSPGMEGANMQIIGQFSDKFSTDFYEKVELLNKELQESFSTYTSTSEFKINSYFISEDEAEKLVNKANVIFSQLGFECKEYIVDGKEYDITGIVNKTLNEELSKTWGFDVYDKDTITIHSLDFEKIDTASISISSVELLMNKNNSTNQQHFTLKINNNLIKNKKEDKNLENNDLSFSATYRQKREAIDNALDPIIVKDAEDKIISETFYYLDDFDDQYCLVEKYTWNESGREEEYGRFTYSFDDSEIKATITSDFEKLIKTALTQEEYDGVMADRSAFKLMSADFEALKIEVENYKNSISTLETEKSTLSEQIATFETSISEKDATITTLQKYHDDNEFEIKKSQIEDVIAEFEVTLGENEEFKVIKEKAMTYEIDVLEKELYFIEGKVKHQKSTKPAKKSQVFSSKVSVVDVEPSGESYYGDAAKYIPKN